MARHSMAAIDRWFFYQDAANLWKWARIDVFGTVLSYSGSSFATRDECLDDARRSGYTDDIVRDPVTTASAHASERSLAPASQPDAALLSVPRRF